EAYHRDDMPEEWGYDSQRTGDVVVSLDPGYFFVNRPGPPIRPVDPLEGPVGMHGYPVSKSPEMLGFLGVLNSAEGSRGADLGKVDGRQLHATVAELLGVEPSATALAEPLSFSISRE